MSSMGKANKPPAIRDLISSGTGMLRQTGAPRKLIMKQLTEALATGGVKAKIPMIQQAVSASRQQMAGGLAQTAEQLAQRNIGGPFASRILAGQRLSGEQALGQIPTQMTEQFISQMLPYLGSTQQLGGGMLGSGAGMLSQLEQFNAQQQMAAIGALSKGMSPSGMISGLIGGSK